MLDILTDDELAQLSGYRRPFFQVQWLVQNGIHHWKRKDGVPVVPRSSIEQRQHEERRQGPDLDGLQSRGRVAEPGA